jgi:phosphate transport system protein
MAPAVEHRAQFHHDLEDLERQVWTMAADARASLELSLRALANADLGLCETVIADDDHIDAAYQEIEMRAVDLIGRQQPVASDLRLLVALMHVALHLERIGDMAVNIASATRSSAALPSRDDVLGRLQEMGDTALTMIDLAAEVFRRRDQARCEQLPELDDRIDETNRAMLDRVLLIDHDPQQREWALQMLQVSRYLERAADHAVDIAEQAWFLITGELRELD